MLRFILGFIMGCFAKKLWRIAWTKIKAMAEGKK
jgi:hypothetical protein